MLTFSCTLILWLSVLTFLPLSVCPLSVSVSVSFTVPGMKPKTCSVLGKGTSTQPQLFLSLLGDGGGVDGAQSNVHAVQVLCHGAALSLWFIFCAPLPILDSYRWTLNEVSV